ncbi:MAG: patatin-like phospholipase family protein [Candidatus Nanopelagicales bacterium]
MSTDDGLALPIDYQARYGDGHRRTAVLGGGGIFFVAWQLSYLRTLERKGIDLGSATRIVGTSAGSVVATLLAGGRLAVATRELGLLAKVPSVLAAMAPADGLQPSQQRALDLFRDATDAQPGTVRAIGFAALAADALPAAKLRRTLAGTLALRGWPSAALVTTTVDTYTGERLAVTSAAGVSAAAAAAASSSVPGLFSPQPVGDRRCMDGGVSGSGTHCDLVAGAKRVVVLSLGANRKEAVPMMTIQPDALQREVAALRDAGSDVLVRGPRTTDLDVLMDPAAVPAAMAEGQGQAEEDAPEFADFWH